jgi:DNA-binding transcriptional ArsR family regulator
VRLLCLLREEELSVSEIEEILGMAQSRISSQLAQLRNAELVRDRRDGKRALLAPVLALGFLVEGATGMSFASYFEKTIWAETGAESRGAWLINNKNETSTYNGFSARPHDWLRIGVMVLRELKNSESCFGKFLKDATSRKIAVFGPGPARGYGYQIWHQCGTSDFCFVGFGGQYLIFNVEKNIVVYQHATTLSNVVWGTTSVMSSLIQGLETVDAIN